MKLRETERSQCLVCTCCEPSLGKSHPEVGTNQREICKTENHFCIRLDVTLLLGQENKESSKRKLLTWHFISHGKKNRAAGEKKKRETMLAVAANAHTALTACTAHLPKRRHQLPDRRHAACECISLKKDRDGFANESLVGSPVIHCPYWCRGYPPGSRSLRDCLGSGEQSESGCR